MPDFKKKPNQNNCLFDLEYDKVLIEQSIAKQYGVVPSEQGDLHYSDWSKMVSGLMEDTPLGRIVSIRSEKDSDVIRKFTPEQKRIRNEWMNFRLQQQTNENDIKQSMKNLQTMLANMFRG
ncbi:MAG: hypothetical protein KHW79_11780 [Clostridiales bacterium]|nr:hypothetical protein [Clostridiales bacterium]